MFQVFQGIWHVMLNTTNEEVFVQRQMSADFQNALYGICFAYVLGIIMAIIFRLAH
jgi:hypothetical protein